MMKNYEETIEKLKKYNQNEIVNIMSKVYTEEENKKLIEQLNRIDLNQVMNLYKNANNIPLIDERKIEHIEYTDLNSLSEEKFKEYKNIGIDVIKNNKYAVITMAGGQGTRLGHKGPKGTFKINTVNGEKYLFEIIVESLQKANKKYNVVIPWYIMTSEDNNDQTIQFLKENNFKGSLEVVDGNTHLFLKGKSAHASQPQLGNNAASNLCHYIASVTDNSYTKFVDEYLYNDYLGEKFNVAFTGEMGPLTVNLGILDYENNEGSLTLDLRLPHDSDNDVLVKNVDEAVNKYGLSEEHDIGPALYVDPNSELVQKLHESYVQFTNDHEHGPQTIGGGTYAKKMPNCVAFGCEFPGKNHHMHEENELISLDDLLTAAAIYAQSLYNLIKK